jgi:hypothetical protein
MPPAVLSYVRFTSALGLADAGFVEAVGLGAERRQAEREAEVLAAYMAGAQAQAQRATEESQQRGFRCQLAKAGLRGGR